MKKILPSERISNEIFELLENGSKDETNILTQLVHKSVKKLVQEILEQEVKDYLGRDYYERNPENRQGYRNGYEVKNLKTAEGNIQLDVPQLRQTQQTYRSNFLNGLSDKSPALNQMILEMYARGLSTRDIEDTLKDLDGNLLISKSGVSEITEALSEEYKRFCQRDLSNYDVVYLFVDGVYESLRLEAGLKEAILCAWGILSNGSKVLLHLGLGNKESYESWQDFFRNMLSRGLRIPLLVISDGAPGLIRAIDECFPDSKRQRCLAHKLRNIANKLPHYAQDEVMAKIRNVYYQTDREIAQMCAAKVIEEYASTYPSAIDCFQRDFDSCVNYMEFPKGHHRHIRTTNLLERCFAEQKRRTKVIPRFLNEKSCLKLVFATLIRVSNKWRKIKMSEFDLTLLKNIRSLYGWNLDEKNYISKKVAA